MAGPLYRRFVGRGVRFDLFHGRGQARFGCCGLHGRGRGLGDGGSLFHCPVCGKTTNVSAATSAATGAPVVVAKKAAPPKSQTKAKAKAKAPKRPMKQVIGQLTHVIRELSF